MRPFLRAKIIKSYVFLSVILWCPNLQVTSVQFSVFVIRLFIEYSIPQTFSVSNPCNISLGHFLVSFYWLAANYILTYFPEIQQIFS